MTQTEIKEFSVFLIEGSSGDSSSIHLNFVVDAHLKLALTFSGNDHVKARSHLKKANEFFEHLCSLVLDGDERDKARGTRKMKELKFRICLTSCEVLFEGDSKDEALKSAQEAKGLLDSVPELACELGIFCYNCGVKEHRKKCLDGSVSWLSLSVDSFDRIQNASNLSRSLRLLCACHLDKKEAEQAKKVCLLAVEIDPCIQSLAMMCRVNLADSDLAALEASLKRLLQADTLTLSVIVDVIEECRLKGASKLGLWAVNAVEEKFGSDSSLDRARLQHFLLIRSIDGPKKAQKYVEEILADHSSSAVRLSSSVCNEIIVCCFGHAKEAMDEENHEEAIAWLSLCLSLLPNLTNEDAKARAQFHRLLCGIYLQMDDLVEALNQANSAVRANAQAASYYFLAKCQLRKGDIPATLETLRIVATCKDFSAAIVYNIAAMAQAQGSFSVMAEALEQYMNALSSSETEQIPQIVAGARALIRAWASSREYGAIGRVVSKLKSQGWDLLFPEDSKDGEWIAKAVYNAAVSSFSEKKDILVAGELFDLAAELCSKFQATLQLVSVAKKFAVQCFLDKGPTKPTKEQLGVLSEHLFALRASGNVKEEELLLLEFRFCLLQSPACEDVCAFIQRVSSKPSMTSPKLYERMASACLEAKNGLAEAAIKALTICFRLHVASRPNMNTERCCVVVRNLLSLLSLSPAKELQDSHLNLLREIIDVVKSEPTWSTKEKQWLTIMVWNMGSYEWRKSRFTSAEQWCSVAMGLVKLCGPNWTL